MRRTDYRQSIFGVVAAAAVVIGIAAADLWLGRDRSIEGLLAMVPFLTALFCGPLLTVFFGAVAIAVAVGLGAYHNELTTSVQAARLAGIGFAAVVAAVGAWVRARRLRQLAAVQAVAEATQQALLRPLPGRLGDLRLTGRYRSADAAAQIGGDLYEAVDTVHGVRLLIGDVRGKGLAAVSLTSVVIGSFREAAHAEETLTGVAERMDSSVRRHGGGEDFVTALLVERSHPDTVTLVGCGHPPPVLLSAGAVRPVDIADTGLPLGFSAPGTPVVAPLGPGDRLFLYTDGLTDARDRRGRGFPLLDVVQRCAAPTTAEACLALIMRAVRRHARRRLLDDVAMIMVECRQQPVPAPAEERDARSAVRGSGGREGREGRRLRRREGRHRSADQPVPSG